MRNRWLSFLILAVLVLSNLGAAQESSGTIRGYVFRDSNQNGVFDAGEEGIPGVYVTISYDKYSHTYYTGAGDASGSAPGPGSYGPTPLQGGSWMVTLHVPDGYRATTPTQMWVIVPDTGATTGVNFGIYGSGPITYAAGTDVGSGIAGSGGGAGAGTLPATGGVGDIAFGQWFAMLVALAGLIALIGTPWCVTQARRVHRRWW